MTYKLYKTILGQDGALIVNKDGSMTSFLFNPENQDYQAYLVWIAEGNQPLPAEENT